MVWGHSIRRVLGFARRHGWGGAAILLFVGAIATGGEPVLAGAHAFLSRFDPGMAAKASDQPEHGVVHLAMTGFEPSRFAPQVLFPVTARLFPSWMRSKPVAVPAPPPASAKLAAAMPESAPALPAGPPATNLKPAIAICIDDLGEDLAG